MTFGYYFGEKYFEFEVDWDDVIAKIKAYLSVMTHNELVETILDLIPNENLIKCFYDELHDDFQKEAIKWWEENR